MTNKSEKAGIPRQEVSGFRRFTRSTRDFPHQQLSDKGKAEWIVEKKKQEVSLQFIDLASSESDQGEDAEGANLGGEDMEVDSSGYTLETDPSEEKSAEERVAEEDEFGEEEAEEDNESDHEHTSEYTPLEYPIFPPLIWGPDEDEPDTWGLFSPTSRLIRTAPDPPRSPENAPKREILLRGCNTVYPGSPGYLPESITTEKYSEEVMGNGPKESLYRKLVKYAAKTWKFRVPTTTKEAEKDDQMGIDMIDRDADGWYTAHVESKLPYKPVEYPIFPEDFYETDDPKIGKEKYIELRGKDTVLPGSPGHLPEKVPVADYWYEFYLNDGEDKPNTRWIEYAQKTWKDRIPLEEAKRKRIQLDRPMSEEEIDAWYFSFREEGDT